MLSCYSSLVLENWDLYSDNLALIIKTGVVQRYSMHTPTPALALSPTHTCTHIHNTNKQGTQIADAFFVCVVNMAGLHL